jgi:hypothetical protein
MKNSYMVSETGENLLRTHNTINHQQSDKVKYAPQKCWGTVMAPMALTWYRHFKGKGGLNRILTPPTPLPL